MVGCASRLYRTRSELLDSLNHNDARSQPRVSFVAALRDLSYGGDLLRRVGIFLNGIIFLANRHRLRCEVILVEWNNPWGSPPLHHLVHPLQNLQSIAT